MSTQISLKLSDKMYTKAKSHVNTKGFDNLQDFIRELIRERLFEPEPTGFQTAKASEKSLGKKWLTKEEDKAWTHLEKEK